MLIYKNTFDNIKTMGFDFPVEDSYYASENEAIIADGITRDPIGISDFSSCSPLEFLKKYPRPSGAELASKKICESFHFSKGTLKERLIEANKAVKKINEGIDCNYLENDYYAAVASCINIDNDVLYWAYICDCGVIVYDSLGNIKFQTQDDKELYSDKYIDEAMNKLEISWNLPEARKMVRKNFRNNPNNIQDGKCVSYGALTGEDCIDEFIKEGKLNLEKGDYIIVYSDGFTNFLKEKSFIEQVLNFNIDSFENYINEKSKEDYNKYGKEKTLIMFKN